LGEVLEPVEKSGVELSEELIVEEVQTAEGDFRISENTRGDEGKKCDQRDGAHKGKVGDDDCIISALIPGKPHEGL
jgi:hypothetical protein